MGRGRGPRDVRVDRHGQIVRSRFIFVRRRRGRIRRRGGGVHEHKRVGRVGAQRVPQVPEGVVDKVLDNAAVGRSRGVSFFPLGRGVQQELEEMTQRRIGFRVTGAFSFVYGVRRVHAVVFGRARVALRVFQSSRGEGRIPVKKIICNTRKNKNDR